MSFTPQFLDQLRARVSMEDVIGRRVKLIRRGREFVGLSPFQNEKTPSFTVVPEKGFYHCFSSGEHGDIIDFVMKTESLSFPEAVEKLAAEAGLEVPKSTPEEDARAVRAKGLYEVIEAAAAYFERLLRMPEGREALDYLHDRGISEDTIHRFRLGFAAATRDGLKAALIRQKIPQEMLLEAGLIIQPEDQARPAYDRFRGRVMFPITDRRGRVVAFGGRILEAAGPADQAPGQGSNKPPKYLNSPETPLFHKGRNLYGLALARAAAQQDGTVIVAEGYTDVLALHQAGFETAVAPLGTALTEDQMAELWRICREPVLCFDGDGAGRRAAGRAADRALPLLRPGYALRFALLPDGEDPDSLIKRAGPGDMAAVVAQAIPLSEILWRAETDGRRLDSPDARAWLEKRLTDHAGRIVDETVRGHYVAAFRDRLWREFKKRRSGGRGRPEAAVQLAEKTGAGAKVDMGRLREEILVLTLIAHPELFDAVGERLGSLTLSAPGLDDLRQAALKALTDDPALDSKPLQDHLCQSGFADILEHLMRGDVFGHAAFARPEGSTETAREGWEETLSLFAQSRLMADIREAERQLAEDPSAEAFRLLRALKEAQALGQDEPRMIGGHTAKRSDSTA